MPRGQEAHSRKSVVKKTTTEITVVRKFHNVFKIGSRCRIVQKDTFLKSLELLLL